MLNDIKKTCSIFLLDWQYAQLVTLKEHAISILWKHRDLFKEFVFFHNKLFNTLIQLTPTNLKTFFETAKIGPTGDAENILNVLYTRQMSCPITVVNIPPVYPIVTVTSAPFPVYQHPTQQPFVQVTAPVNHYPPPPYSSSVPVHQHPGPSQVHSPAFFNPSHQVHQHIVSRNGFRPFQGP